MDVFDGKLRFDLNLIYHEEHCVKFCSLKMSKYIRGFISSRKSKSSSHFPSWQELKNWLKMVSSKLLLDVSLVLPQFQQLQYNNYENVSCCITAFTNTEITIEISKIITALQICKKGKESIFWWYVFVKTYMFGPLVHSFKPNFWNENWWAS